MLLSDDFQLIATLLRHLAGHAARLPAMRLADLLNSNPSLADGSPLIGASTTTHGYSVAALAEAASLLRTVVSDSGNVLNLSPAVWLVPAAGEFLARQTLRLLDTQIQVITNPWLSESFSFLLAASSIEPVFVRLMLAAPLRPTVSSVPAPAHFDGQILDVECAFGISVVDRKGLVTIPV